MPDFDIQTQQPRGEVPREELIRDVVDELEREHEELMVALQRELGLIA